MKHLKLFEEISIKENEFPIHGYDLSVIETKILTDIVGEKFLDRFVIKVDDHYYFTHLNIREIYDSHGSELYNMFDNLNDLKNYLLCWYYIHTNTPKKLIEHLKTSKLDPSFDDNWPIWWAYENGHREIIRFLLNDERVRDKLTEEEINRITNEIS